MIFEKRYFIYLLNILIWRKSNKSDKQIGRQTDRQLDSQIDRDQ